MDCDNAFMDRRSDSIAYIVFMVGGTTMEPLIDKFWAVVAAVISALGGFVLYERKKVDKRLSIIERDLSQHKSDLAVVKESLSNLKEDTQEIKEGQKDIMIMLSVKHRK